MSDIQSYLTKAAIAGGSCTIAGSILNPIDVVKIRMQNNSPAYPWPEKNTIKGILKIVREEGAAGLCRGLNATIMREMIYSTIRMGAYEPILSVLSRSVQGDADISQAKVASPWIKFASALLSGGLGAVVANPTDLIKVNFQAVLPGQKLPYSTTIGGFIYTFKHQGFRGLYKGGVVTTCRAALVTSASIGSYDSIKNNVLKKHFGFSDDMPLFCVCSLLAGVIATTAANPVDVIKTRYMSDATSSFSGPLDCALTTFKQGGPRAFFQGWTPAFFRIGPYTILAFVLMEQIRMAFGLNTL